MIVFKQPRNRPGKVFCLEEKNGLYVAGLLVDVSATGTSADPQKGIQPLLGSANIEAGGESFQVRLKKVPGDISTDDFIGSAQVPVPLNSAQSESLKIKVTLSPQDIVMPDPILSPLMGSPILSISFQLGNAIK